MPNRIIHAKATQSMTLERLSDFTERTFWRLTTVADDYGRFDAEPAVMLSRCYERRLSGARDARRMEVARDEMAAAGLIVLYRHRERLYGAFCTWQTYQRERTSKSKYPGQSEEGSEPYAPPCGELRRVAASCGSRAHAREPLAVSREPLAESREPGNSAPRGESPRPAPPRTQFRVPTSISEALDRAPKLGADQRIRTPAYWQALVRAHGGVNYGHEILKAEAWMVSNPAKAPRKNLARFLARWVGRAEPPDEEPD